MTTDEFSTWQSSLRTELHKSADVSSVNVSQIDDRGLFVEIILIDGITDAIPVLNIITGLLGDFMWTIDDGLLSSDGSLTISIPDVYALNEMHLKRIFAH